jgi:hypothetical protein
VAKNARLVASCSAKLVQLWDTAKSDVIGILANSAT